MRKFLIFFMFLSYKNAFCQLNETFDDGDFTNYPEWTGNVNDFTIDNGLLRSNSTALNQSFYLSAKNQLALDCVWEFDCNLKFAVSGNNYVDVYLVSDTDNLKSEVINGYFLRIGHTKKTLVLYKRTGNINSIIKLIEGQDNIVSSGANNTFSIRVSRDIEGKFSLEWDKSQSRNNYTLEGESIADLSFLQTGWFGFVIQQSTASFQKKHYFDNITIKSTDNSFPKPIFTSAKEKIINILFNKPISGANLHTPSNYQITPHQVINSVQKENNEIILMLEDELLSGEYSIHILNLEGIYGNAISQPLETRFSYTKPYLVKRKDIIINEIFADPSPQIDLPTSEFIELYNITEHTLPLKGFKYFDTTTTYIFGDIYIAPKEYLILCSKNDTTEYQKYGRTLGISPWPTLNNASDIITLTDADDNIIDAVHYFDSWYRDPVKKNGGYTLELIDPFSDCIHAQNYAASMDPSGGTPGRKNSLSIPSDPQTITVQNIYLKDNNKTVLVQFNKAIDSLYAVSNHLYSINNGVGTPDKVSVNPDNFAEISLQYNNGITPGLNYNVEINKMVDCAGNMMEKTIKPFISPAEITKHDILISEVLFNPKANSQSFIEIYNHSDKTFDLKNLFLATLAKDRDSVINIKAVTESSVLILPREYWVLSTNPENVKSEYYTSNPGHFIKMSSIPSYSVEKGTVILLNPQKERIDQFSYDKKMHFPLLKDVKGVSLERSFYSREANAPGNFRSAAAAVGYATPAYQNSQYMEENVTVSKNTIQLSSKAFSPDNDGVDDILTIGYLMENTDYVANVSIYNEQGKLVRKLINNEKIGKEGMWIWDGFNDVTERVKSGIYIINTELFHINGDKKNFRNAVGLVNKQ